MGRVQNEREHEIGNLDHIGGHRPLDHSEGRMEQI